MGVRRCVTMFNSSMTSLEKTTYSTQNDLLLTNLLDFYKNSDNIDLMLNIITGTSKVSLRIVDWFATNYAKKNYTYYINDAQETQRKVCYYFRASRTCAFVSLSV